MLNCHNRVAESTISAIITYRSVELLALCIRSRRFAHIRFWRQPTPGAPCRPLAAHRKIGLPSRFDAPRGAQ
jgi:hypothetical protein